MLISAYLKTIAGVSAAGLATIAATFDDRMQWVTPVVWTLIGTIFFAGGIYAVMRKDIQNITNKLNEQSGEMRRLREDRILSHQQMEDVTKRLDALSKWRENSFMARPRLRHDSKDEG